MGWFVTIPLGSFVAGLLAFPHCALMCGPLFALFSSSWTSYQSGRILGYSLVGGLLGALGFGLDWSGLFFVSLQNLSILLIALIFLGYATLRLLQFHPSALLDYTAPLARWMNRLRNKRHAALGIFLAGSLSALLPCGVLLPLWALCAGSASPVFGASMGLAFVLGTIPGALLFRLLLRQAWWKRIHVRRSFRFVSAMALAALGVLVLSYRSILVPSIQAANPEREGNLGVQCAPGLPFVQ